MREWKWREGEHDSYLEEWRGKKIKCSQWEWNTFKRCGEKSENK